MSLSGFLLIEQLLITDGTLAPLNRLRIIYAFAAAIALFIFGIGAAVVASRYYGAYPSYNYHHSKSSFFFSNYLNKNFLFFRCHCCFYYCFYWCCNLYCRSNRS